MSRGILRKPSGDRVGRGAKGMVEVLGTLRERRDASSAALDFWWHCVGASPIMGALWASVSTRNHPGSVGHISMTVIRRSPRRTLMKNSDFDAGKRFRQEGDIVEALRCLRSALDEDEDSVETYVELALTY